jgi:hypothetical protein
MNGESPICRRNNMALEDGGRRAIRALGPLVMVACGCGSSPPGMGADGGTSLPAPGQLSLSVNRAIVVKNRDSSSSAWSTTVTFLRVTLANGAGSPDVPLNVGLFSIKTQAGTSKTATTDAPFQANGATYRAAVFLEGTSCDPMLSVSGGASVTCNLAVSFDGEVAPSELRYQTPGAVAAASGAASPTADKRSATAPIVADPCTPCGTVCTDLHLDPKHCGECDADISSSGASCIAGKPLCAEEGSTFCPRVGCVDTRTDRENCGACGRPVVAGKCVDGQPVCDANTLSCPGLACVPTVGRDNCGACGKGCNFSQQVICSHAQDDSYWCSTLAPLRANDSETCTQACARSGYERCTLARQVSDAGSSHDKTCDDINPGGPCDYGCMYWNCWCATPPR